MLEVLVLLLLPLGLIWLCAVSRSFRISFGIFVAVTVLAFEYLRENPLPAPVVGATPAPAAAPLPEPVAAVPAKPKWECDGLVNEALIACAMKDMPVHTAGHARPDGYDWRR